MAEYTLPAHEARRLQQAAGGDPRRLQRLEDRRAAGYPLQYLEGTAPFGPLDLVVDEWVLIPRPETEQLWELAVSLVDRPRVVVDLGTGSGALALACKRSFPHARVIATEASPEAAEVARLNAARLELGVEVVVGDLFDPLPGEVRGGVDLIVSNPPYVAEREWGSLPVDVHHEPRQALVAGPTGTEVIDRIVEEASDWLSAGGWLAIEIGERQGAHVASAMGGRLAAVEVRRDLAGRDRFAIGRRR